VVLGDVLSDAQVAAMTAVGGLLLLGVALRLLRVREVPVADLLPALFLAPGYRAAAVAFTAPGKAAGRRGALAGRNCCLTRSAFSIDDETAALGRTTGYGG